MLSWSYLVCAFTDPGRVPDQWMPFDTEEVCLPLCRSTHSASALVAWRFAGTCVESQVVHVMHVKSLRTCCGRCMLLLMHNDD